MRPLTPLILCLLLIPSMASAQIDWERFFDHPVRDFDTGYPPVPLPPPTVIADYTFEGCSPEGWTTNDITSQDAYFHVDDFAGLSAPYGPIAGTKSLWCGARPGGSEPLCTYMMLPGYGNYWVQYWTTDSCLPVSGDVSISFAASWDTEAGYDATFVEYDACDDNWTVAGGGFGVFDGLGSTPLATITIPAAAHTGNVRVRFRFQSDNAWSDEDALYNTNGAIIVDNLVVDDGGGNVVPAENFEGEAVGSLSSNDWQASGRTGRGDFAALFSGGTLVQEDPAYTNLSCLWAFISGSTVNYGCGGHAGQAAVPYVQDDTAIWNDIRSPWIPFTGPSGYSTTLKFQVYRDLPMDNLVFYEWWVREFLFLASCPSEWRNNNFVYHSDRKDWYTQTVSLTPYIHTTTSSDQLQVSLRVVDLSPYWSGLYGTGACHSHAPLIDNVQILREFGATFVARSLSLFQDRFPENGTTTGTVRVDGVDSDFFSIQIVDPTAPIDYLIPGDPNSGPAVFCSVHNLPNKVGAIVSGGQQWPVVSTGQDWTVVQMSTGSAPHEYIVDLNDQLYTPGDKVEYYISARNKDGVYSYWSAATGQASEVTAQQYPMEMTCLPTLPAVVANQPTAVEFLYVDGFSGLGAQPLIETAMSNLGLTWDRFDRNEPLQARANGLGDLATYEQIAQYDCIIWNTGDIYNNVFTDADFELMFKYLEQKPNARLFLTGDNAAKALATSTSPAAANLRASYFNFTLLADDHHNILPAVSPPMTGVAGSPFDGLTTLAFVGAKGQSHFDVLAPDGSAFMGMVYGGDPQMGALLFQEHNTARTALAGFSLHAVRDDGITTLPDRVAVLSDLLTYFGKQTSPVGVGSSAKRDFLAQNVPNPCNPSTRIAYSMSRAGSVTLRVYDVAGRLVRTLVDDDHSPAGRAEVAWDGRDDRGASVASGVYFYRLEAGSFVSTRKMVLLK